MRKILLTVAALCLAGPAVAVDGAAVYASKCVACHGKDGKGTASGKKLGAHDLTAEKHAEAEVSKVVESGKAKMPAFKGKLSPDEIAAVSKYVAGGLK